MAWGFPVCFHSINKLHRSIQIIQVNLISFMYDAYGIKTEVVSEEEFIKAMRDE